MLRLLDETVCDILVFCWEGAWDGAMFLPQTPPLYLYLFIISVFKKVVRTSCAIAPVDTA